MKTDAFFALADALHASLQGQELLFCHLAGEISDFVRLSRSRVRQAGHVASASLGLTLIEGGRQTEAVCDLAGDMGQDLARARELLARLRERIQYLPRDPYLNYSAEPSVGDRRVGQAGPEAEEAIETLIAAAGDLDLVGIWASGAIQEGLSSSIGHRQWHESPSFNLDWSCHLDGDRAVKDGYGGLTWDPSRLGQKLDAMREGLAIQSRPLIGLQPGRYRAYLAPAAVQELMDMLAWGGFDLKECRTHQSPLLRLARGERAFDPAVTLREEHDRGLVANFTPEGFAKPASVTLIEAGRFGDCLVEARAAKEYGETVNASGGAPESLALEPGELAGSQVLAGLDRGLYIGNLWYCNWSDPNDCRITGMTRFGTYWVEDGRLVAPVSVMRFDESLYHLLGDRLEGLTRDRELILSAQTYDGRSTESALLPGLLVSGIDLTL